MKSPQLNWRQEVEAILADSSLEHWSQKSLALQEAGFWLHERRDTLLQSGPKLSLGTLRIDSLEFNLEPKLLNAQNWKFELKQVLSTYADQGYPFASLEIINYLVQENELHAFATLKLGQQFRFDSLIVLGYTKVDPNLLGYEIDWQKGGLYQEKYLQEVQNRLEASDYLSAQRAPALAFYPQSAHLYLYLNKRSSNQISGIIGLNTEADGRTTLNGDFNLNLLNTFNKGEAIQLRWRSPNTSVQDFQLRFAYPYLWGSPLGIKAGVELFRQDSSFIQRFFETGFNYRIAYQASLELNARFRSSNQLGASSVEFQNLGSYSSAGLSLGFRLKRLNQSIVATQGYRFTIELGSRYREAEAAEWQQYDWRFDAAYYHKMGSAWVWHQAFSSEGIGGSPLFENELFRLGGINSLRGFNELSLFSSAYGLMRSEIRYMLGKYDYLCLFGDLAYSENNSSLLVSQNLHSGLGGGINFQTKGGIFSLFLAVGQTDDDSYDWRSTKVHLSYVNTF